LTEPIFQHLASSINLRPGANVIKQSCSKLQRNFNTSFSGSGWYPVVNYLGIYVCHQAPGADVTKLFKPGNLLLDGYCPLYCFITQNDSNAMEWQKSLTSVQDENVSQDFAVSSDKKNC
jgi:hypothetical protein